MRVVRQVFDLILGLILCVVRLRGHSDQLNDFAQIARQDSPLVACSSRTLPFHHGGRTSDPVSSQSCPSVSPSSDPLQARPPCSDLRVVWWKAVAARCGCVGAQGRAVQGVLVQTMKLR